MLDKAIPAQVMGFHETDPAAARILAHHYPAVPNHGDISTVDWARYDSPTWLSAGYPCQPFSFAGRKQGTADPRHLWPHIAKAIRYLQPSHVFLENVVGHVKLGLTEVLNDLRLQGYGVTWMVYAASAVGAPHMRRRVFIYATHTHTHFQQVLSPTVKDRRLLPTAEAKLHRSGPDYARASRPNSGGDDLTTAVWKHLSNPDGRWGIFADAVKKWEDVTETQAPPPFDAGVRDGFRLSAQFVEWMMGCPPGWVTAVDGVSWKDQIKILGNSVVWRQAQHALVRLMAAPAPVLF